MFGLFQKHCPKIIMKHCNRFIGLRDDSPIGPLTNQTTAAIESTSHRCQKKLCEVELASARQDVENWKTKVTKRQKNFENCQAALDRAKDALREEGRERRKLETSNEKLRSEYNTLNANARKLRDAYSKIKDYPALHAKVSADLAHARESNVEKDRELSSLHAKLQANETLLRTRSAELKEALDVVTQIDSISHAEAISMVSELNFTILQTAAQIVYDLQFKRKDSLPDRSQSSSHHTIASRLGHNIAYALSTKDHSDDQILVQIVLQAIMIRFATMVIQTWNDTRHDEFLQSLYEEVYKSETQTMSSKWRTLTRKHAKQLEESPELERATENVIEWISYILMFASEYDDAECIHPINLGKRFGEKIRDIMALSRSIRKAIGEDIMKSDFRLISPFETELFIDTDMEDSMNITRGTSSMSDAQVFCTTDLGLKRLDKTKKEEKDGEVRYISKSTVVVKAKVALFHTIAEILKEDEVPRNGLNSSEPSRAVGVQHNVRTENQFAQVGGRWGTAAI